MSSLLPHYTHIINPRLKHTYLSFDDEGGLVIKSPAVSQAYIETLLIKKASWIRRSQERFARKKGRTGDLVQGATLFFLGKAYPLELYPSRTKRTLFRFEETHFVLKHTDDASHLMQKHIDRFYKEEAQKYIPPLVEKWSARMGVTPTGIRFRKTKRQWGSCSSKNSLSFNTMLMKLPLEAIEYVVVHELAHIVHKHHQKAFWDLVVHYLPDYRERQQIVREYSPT